MFIQWLKLYLSTTMLYHCDKFLNDIIENQLSNKDVSITNVEFISNDFYIVITFSNGIIITGWCYNMWYCWFNNGDINDKYKWDAKRLKRKTIWKLRKRLIKYALENCDYNLYNLMRYGKL